MAKNIAKKIKNEILKKFKKEEKVINLIKEYKLS